MITFIRSSKILFISDIHLDILYNSHSPTKAAKSYFNCHNITHFLHGQADEFDYGRFNCNTPESLLRMTLTRALLEDSLPSIVMLGGDFVAHGIVKLNITNDADKKINLELFKNTLKKVISIIREYIPEPIPVLPAFGNNDFTDHYNIPSDATRKEKYTYVKELFFSNAVSDKTFKHKLNRDFQNTIMQGLYYSYQFNDKFNMIFLFSNYFSIKNKSPTEEEAFNQLIWLEKTLLSLNTKQAIIVLHIPPYAFYIEGKASGLWHSKFTKIFEGICYKHKKKISVILSGHTHWSRIMGRKYINEYKPILKKNFLKKKENENYLGVITLPSVTPVYYNNPGYSTIIIEGSIISNIIVDFADLKQTLDLSRDHTLNKKIDVNKLFSIKYDFMKDFHFGKIDNLNIVEFVHSKLKHNYYMEMFITFSSGHDKNDYPEAYKLIVEKKIADPENQYKGLMCSLKTLYANEYKMCKNK